MKKTLLIILALVCCGCSVIEPRKTIDGVECVKKVYRDYYSPVAHFCPNCKRFVLDKFCEDCGEKITEPRYDWICKDCNRDDMWRSAKICRNCGSKEFKWVANQR